MNTHHISITAMLLMESLQAYISHSAAFTIERGYYAEQLYLNLKQQHISRTLSPIYSDFRLITFKPPDFSRCLGWRLIGVFTTRGREGVRVP